MAKIKQSSKLLNRSDSMQINNTHMNQGIIAMVSYVD